MNRRNPIICWLGWALPAMIIQSGLAQGDREKPVSPPEDVKTGWTFGALPAVAYDSDVGFKYGAVVNLYDFGDGSSYPKYDHSIYLEWSRTTKGNGINQFMYDSDKLIPGVRLSAEASLITDKALDFYGFNGYNSYYNPDYEKTGAAGYKSRMFYRQERKLGRIRAELQGSLFGRPDLRWFTGVSFNSIGIDTVNTPDLNEGKPEEDKLPYTGGGLYGMYRRWGLIPQDEYKGGDLTLLKLGMVYDTRDNEPNPMNGMWTVIQLIHAPAFLAGRDESYTRLVLTHRQYFTLIPETMNFALRISYQGKISGKMPFYMLPFVFNSPPNYTRDGLGGGKTIRGVLRNRVAGESYVFGNAELRWKVLRTRLLKQNFYVALSGFLDGGLVTGKYRLDRSGIPPDQLFWIDKDRESFHPAYGAGVHLALNENFIVAVDYGLAADPRDGSNGLYIGMDFLY